jgi:fatty acid desaturase
MRRHRSSRDHSREPVSFGAGSIMVLLMLVLVRCCDGAVMVQWWCWSGLIGVTDAAVLVLLL